jgi:hypothetical protein
LKIFNLKIYKTGNMRGSTNRQKDVARMLRRRHKHQSPVAHKQERYPSALPRRANKPFANKANEKP